MQYIGLAFILIWVAGAIGWIMNIIKILDILNDPITGIFIFRVVGVFAVPVGAVLGYF